MTKTLRKIFLCIVAAFAIGGIAYYLTKNNDNGTSGEMKKKANGAIDSNFNNKMTSDDAASGQEITVAVEYDVTTIKSTPSVVEGKTNEDEASPSNVATKDECCRRRRLMPTRGGEDPEGEEDCLDVVCDNTDNATKKRKGDLSTTTTGEVNLDGPDEVGVIPKQDKAALRGQHEEQAAALRERQEQEAAELLEKQEQAAALREQQEQDLTPVMDQSLHLSPGGFNGTASGEDARPSVPALLDDVLMPRINEFVDTQYLGILGQVSKSFKKNAEEELQKRKGVRVYMDIRTTRILAHKEREDGTFDAAVDLGLIHHDARDVHHRGSLCLWGNNHVVFQTKFGNDPATLNVRNIHTQVSKQIAINFGYTIMVTMNGHLLVFGFDQSIGQFVLSSFESLELAMLDTPRIERIILPRRPMIRGETPQLPTYGVLKIRGVQTLIVAGNIIGDKWTEPYCHLHVMGGEWEKCARIFSVNDMTTSIVWQNRLVALWNALHLFVYNPDEDVWSVMDTRVPIGYFGSFFLNMENHLCLEEVIYYGPVGDRSTVVYCLEHIDSTEWFVMPIEYAFKTDQNVFMGTLPVKIISTMVTANTAWEAANNGN